MTNHTIVFIDVRFCISRITLHSYLWYSFFFVTLYISTCMFFCIYYKWWTFWNSNEKVSSQLSFIKINQLVGYCWLATTKFINTFCIFWWVYLSIVKVFFLEKTVLISLLIFCLLLRHSAQILLTKLFLE